MKISSLIAAVAIAAISAALCSCDDDGGKYNPNAKVYINGVDMPSLKSTPKGSGAKLTAGDVCKSDSIDLTGQYVLSEGATCWLGFFTISATGADNDGCIIDTAENRLVYPAYKIFGFDDDAPVSTEDPFFNPDVRLYLRQTHGDTLGYIPTASRVEAYNVLLELFKDKDANREKIYDVFTNAFQFIPCTGAEYKAMIERGEQ